MRPTRVLLAVSAAALLAAACGDDSTSGSGAPADSRAAAPSSSAAPSAAADGISALSATEILNRSQAAFKQADSVRLTGSGSSGSSKFGIDMRYSSDGKAIGTVTNSGQKIELRRIGQTVYLKADQAFWTSTAGAEAAKILTGKYLKAPLSDARVKQLAGFTDKNSFADQVLTPSSSVTKGGTKTVHGVPAIGLVDKSGTGSATLYIATTGQPVPLQLAPSAGSAGEGSFDFLDYGKPVDVPVPPAAETIDVTKLSK